MGMEASPTPGLYLGVKQVGKDIYMWTAYVMLGMCVYALRRITM